ncbi:MAG: hypothetical protein IAI48_02325, partial [Candidatus Eremiobacteraeota bacterium]|nr:hypothetical protein [Candidatus Eremiobacteraeota bacterium]
MTSLLRRIAIRTLLFAVAFGIGFARADAGTAGINGTVNVSAANTVVNLYDVAVSASGRTIVTTNIANLQNAALGPVGPGSVLLVYQAQGATIDSSNTVTYGNVTAYNGAGYYEFVTVGSVSGNTITIAASCNALAHTYGATTQIVRVPQYQTLTVAAGASITATAWNGSTGGIVAFDVAGNLTLSGSIVTTGQGFRGAVTYANSGASFGAVPRVTAYVTGQTGAQLASALAAEKGESIAGNGTAYDASFGGRYGRGAPANGGGGGDGHNAGGGGGSNGDNGLTWSGQGLEDTAYDAFYSNANLLNPSGAADPGYGSMKSGSGGGRGGYTYGLPLGSGFADDGRRPVGGLGGRPMNYSGGAASRVFFGGGGGAGDQNNGGGGSGGNGGGIVLLNVGSVSGAGSIVASGAAGGTSG